VSDDSDSGVGGTERDQLSGTPQPGDTAIVQPLVDRQPTARRAPLIEPGSGASTCHNCGHTLEPDDIFCENCGAVRPAVTAAFTGPIVPLTIERPDWSMTDEDEIPGDSAPDQTAHADDDPSPEPEPTADPEPRRELPQESKQTSAPTSEPGAEAEQTPEPASSPEPAHLVEPTSAEFQDDTTAPPSASLGFGDQQRAPLAPQLPPIPPMPDVTSAPAINHGHLGATPTEASVPTSASVPPSGNFPTSAYFGSSAELDEDVEATRIVGSAQTRRPVLLHVSTGERLTVRGSGLLGRFPRPEPGELFDSLLTIVDPGKSVSKTHLELGRDGDDLWVSDRFSGNGTVIRHIDGSIRRCEPGRRYRVERGARVDIGEQFFLVQ
jgi:hypothetical protein